MVVSSIAQAKRGGSEKKNNDDKTVVEQNKLRWYGHVLRKKEGRSEAGMGGAGEGKEEQRSPVKEVEGWFK